MWERVGLNPWSPELETADETTMLHSLLGMVHHSWTVDQPFSVDNGRMDVP